MTILPQLDAEQNPEVREQPKLTPRPYHKTRQADLNSARLKEYLVLLGMRALAHGNMARVGLITELIRGGGMSHA